MARGRKKKQNKKPETSVVLKVKKEKEKVVEKHDTISDKKAELSTPVPGKSQKTDPKPTSVVEKRRAPQSVTTPRAPPKKVPKSEIPLNLPPGLIFLYSQIISAEKMSAHPPNLPLFHRID